MKKAVLLMAAVAMMWCSPAFGLNPDDCPGWIGPEWQCNGRVEFSEMGTFDGSDIFQPGDMWHDILRWDPNMADHEPYRAQEIKKGILQMRNYTNNKGKILTRLQTEIGTITYAPVLWSVTCLNTNMCRDDDKFLMDALPPEGCDPETMCNENGCKGLCETEYWPPPVLRMFLQSLCPLILPESRFTG